MKTLSLFPFDPITISIIKQHAKKERKGKRKFLKESKDMKGVERSSEEESRESVAKKEMHEQSATAVLTIMLKCVLREVWRVGSSRMFDESVAGEKYRCSNRFSTTSVMPRVDDAYGNEK